MNKGQKARSKLDRTQILKLDVGCGENKQSNHLGMDYKPFQGVDVVHDVRIAWPFEDETFSLLSSANLLQQITREHEIFINVMNEAWRVLKYDGHFRIAIPYGGSTLYMSDPMNINPIVPQTFQFFDPFAPLNVYDRYKPKPWKIEQLYWSPDGTIECLLIKRRVDPQYGKNKRKG